MKRSIKILGVALAGTLAVFGCSSPESPDAAAAASAASSPFCAYAVAPSPDGPFGEIPFGWAGMAVDPQGLYVSVVDIRSPQLMLSINEAVDGELKELARLPQVGPEGVSLYSTIPSALLVDATSLYFPQWVAGEFGVYKMPRGGGAAQKLAVATLGALEANSFPLTKTPIARDERHVYFFASGVLSRVPLDGGAVETTDESPLEALEMSMIVDQDNVYIATAASGGSHYEVQRVSKTWGARGSDNNCAACAKPVASDRFSLNLPDCSEGYISMSSAPNGLYVSCTRNTKGVFVYLTPLTQAASSSAPTPVTLTAVKSQADGDGDGPFLIYNDSIYTAQGSAVVKTSLGGQSTNLLTLDAQSELEVSHVATDGKNLYIGSKDCGVQKLPL